MVHEDYGRSHSVYYSGFMPPIIFNTTYTVEKVSLSRAYLARFSFCSSNSERCPMLAASSLWPLLLSSTLPWPLVEPSSG